MAIRKESPGRLERRGSRGRPGPATPLWTTSVREASRGWASRSASRAAPEFATIREAASSGALSPARMIRRWVSSASCTWASTGTPAALAATGHQGMVTVLLRTTSARLARMTDRRRAISGAA